MEKRTLHQKAQWSHGCKNRPTQKVTFHIPIIILMKPKEKSYSQKFKYLAIYSIKETKDLYMQTIKH